MQERRDRWQVAGLLALLTQKPCDEDERQFRLS
jgi:hypothetical protein